MGKGTIDFDTMRVNCIQIHQEVLELIKVSDHIGVDLELCVKTADELRTHPKTKSWSGMGRLAKELYDNEILWGKLPKRLWIRFDHGNQPRKEWVKEEAKEELLDCFYHLGGHNLYKTEE